MTPSVTVTRKGVINIAMNSRKMSKFNAMGKRIREIVVLEDRPFSFVDFKSFVVDGMRYELGHGVIRNYLSKLTRSGEIEFAYNSSCISLELHFTKDVTANHALV